MIARTRVVVEAEGVLGAVACEPPMTVRRLRSDEPGRCDLCLVGTAAGPLAGDVLELSLRLEPHANACLRAAGASLAQGRHGRGTGRVAARVDLGDGARLRADPGTVVVCEGSRVDVAVEIALGARAAVEWRELIVLGRTGERAGAATLRWDVTRAGRPVLRQFVDLRDPQLLDWPGLTAGRRVLATVLLSDPGRTARTVVASSTAVAQRLDAHTALVTVLGNDATEATGELRALLSRAWA